MNRRRGLGSGFDALFPSNTGTTQAVREIPIDAIRENRSQPRTQFDEQALDELAASIREHGLIQPLIVTEHPEGGYELIAGERRWRAARRAGLTQAPALIKDATPQQLLELALVENIQRADLNPLEEGQAYQTLKDEFGLKDEEIAQRVGKSRVAVANTRRLIKLVFEARQRLLDGTLSAGHGRALLRLEQPAQQAAALGLVVQNQLTVRETERLTELLVHESLSPAVQAELLAGTISIAHAQALLSVTDVAQQAELLDSIKVRGLDVRETAQLCELANGGAVLGAALDQIDERPAVRPQTQPASRLGQSAESNRREGTKGRQSLSSEDGALKAKFEEALGMPVHLARNESAIKMTITIYNDEQLWWLYELVAKAPSDS
ncbi:MAG: ParB/RepB/Spo0J family partition protein [Chloroflexales bacterium]|nr:ParB/RepB/Spo0J family partition protein [Chloroflexales bacterium]